MVQVRASKPVGIASAMLPSARIARLVQQIVLAKKVRSATAGFAKAFVAMVLVIRPLVKPVQLVPWIAPAPKGKSVPTVAVERTVVTTPATPTKAKTAPPAPAIANANPLNNA